MSKPTLIFTSFWQANYFVEHGIIKNPYLAYSIALNSPQEGQIPQLKILCRIDLFCPTWDILNKYHYDKDWKTYTESFMALMKTRNERAKEWLNTLENDATYLLCCWENTSKGAHCHRQLIYEALEKNKKYSSEISLVYLHGNEKIL